MRWLLAILLLAATIPLAIPAKVVYRPVADSTCLAWVIYDESRGEPLRGSKAVYDVVKHRMKERSLTACQVVAEAHQFSGYKPGVFEKITPEMLTRYELVAKMAPVVPSCSYFHANYVHPLWRLKMKRCGAVGKHIFYRAIVPKPKEKTK